MEWNIGVEMRDEYRRLELAKGAMKLVHDIMLCRPGENLVITYDTCVDERVVHALTEAAYATDVIPTVLYYPTADGFYADPPQRPLPVLMCGLNWRMLLSCMGQPIEKR